MGALNSLINRANDLGLLQPLLRHGHGQRVSLYADDVVLFLQPCHDELVLIKEIMRVFGSATGLVTNISKCSMTPIQFEEQNLVIAQELLPCKVVPVRESVIYGRA
jgi:hypothetical protein